MPLYLNMLLGTFVFYVVGKFVYPYTERIVKSPILLVLGIMAFATNLLGYNQWNINTLVSHAYKGNFILAELTCLLSFIPILRLCMAKEIRIIEEFGKQSLGIMVIHCLLIVFILEHVCSRFLSMGTGVYYALCSISLLFIIAMSYIGACFINKKMPILLGR